MEHVTYLLGAGASANCLPTYQNFAARFNRFVSLIERYKDSTHEIQSYTRALQDLYVLAKHVKNELRVHNTPDTLAKKYFHKSDAESLQRLKHVLILFFVHEQTNSKGLFFNDPALTSLKQEIEITDRRYDSFLASILRPIPRKLKFLDNISILTWNYDLQFEIAYHSYSELSIPEVQRHIQSYPIIAKEGNEKFDPSKFCVLHLNGLAYSSCNQDSIVDKFGRFIESEREQMMLISDSFNSLMCQNEMQKWKHQKLLCFAWERMNEDFSINADDVTYNNALLVADRTNILVINGYSFPLFNRAFDLRILQSMTKIKKVYIQSPSAKEIKNFLEEVFERRIKPDDIVDLGYWNNFYIPDWLLERKPKIRGYSV